MNAYLLSTPVVVSCCYHCIQLNIHVRCSAIQVVHAIPSPSEDIYSCFETWLPPFVCSYIKEFCHRALTPDLTKDYDERTNLTMYRQFFGLASSVVTTFVHATIIELPETYKHGYLISAVVFAIVLAIPPWITFLTNKEVHKIVSLPLTCFFWNVSCYPDCDALTYQPHDRMKMLPLDFVFIWRSWW